MVKTKQKYREIFSKVPPDKYVLDYTVDEKVGFILYLNDEHKEYGLITESINSDVNAILQQLY